MAIFNSIIFIFGMLYTYYNNPTFNLVKTYKNYKHISILLPTEKNIQS